MRIALRHSRHAALTAVTLLLVACGGGPAAPIPAPTPVEPLPVLARLRIVLPADSVPASQAVVATVTAVDSRDRLMSVGLVAWTTSDAAVATISADGLLLARAPGTTIIRARVGTVEGERVVTVLPPPVGPLPVASVGISPVSAQLDIGQSLPLAIIPRDFAGNPLTDRDITFTTSDAAVAVVASDGTVTARAPGIAVIEASSEGRRAAAVITVPAPRDTSIVVKISSPEPDAIFADSLVITATVRSPLPLVSVVSTVAGSTFPMRVVLVSNSGLPQPTWVVTADLSSLPYGPLALVVTATDAAGGQGVLVVPVVRNPRLVGGSRPPPANK
ncbi:MAG: Ig-like domain-containing protein [Gemmatimonadota bacterium]